MTDTHPDIDYANKIVLAPMVKSCSKLNTIFRLIAGSRKANHFHLKGTNWYFTNAFVGT
jgi:hypothetical protein